MRGGQVRRRGTEFLPDPVGGASQSPKKERSHGSPASWLRIWAEPAKEAPRRKRDAKGEEAVVDTKLASTLQDLAAQAAAAALECVPDEEIATIRRVYEDADVDCDDSLSMREFRQLALSVGHDFGEDHDGLRHCFFVLCGGAGITWDLFLAWMLALNSEGGEEEGTGSSFVFPRQEAKDEGHEASVFSDPSEAERRIVRLGWDMVEAANKALRSGPLQAQAGAAPPTPSRQAQPLRRVIRIRDAVVKERDLFCGLGFEVWRRARRLRPNMARRWSRHHVFLYLRAHPELQVRAHAALAPARPPSPLPRCQVVHRHISPKQLEDVDGEVLLSLRREHLTHYGFSDLYHDKIMRVVDRLRDAEAHGGEGRRRGWLARQNSSRSKGGKGRRRRMRGSGRIRNWRKGELLGKGQFGFVYIGLNEDTGAMMAVKVRSLPPGLRSSRVGAWSRRPALPRRTLTPPHLSPSRARSCAFPRTIAWR